MQTNDARLIAPAIAHSTKFLFGEQTIFAFFTSQESTVTIFVRSPGRRRRRRTLLLEEEVVMAVEEEAHGFAFA